MTIEAQYQQQLAAKKKRLTGMLQPFGAPELEVYESERSRYRLRAEFRIWHEGDDFFYAMFEPGDKRAPIRIEDSPMVAEPIRQLMMPLLEALKASPVLFRKLFQVDFLSSLSGEVLVTLLYHRPLDDDWQAQARELKQQFGINLIGRSRKTKIVMDRDYVVEELPVGGKTYRYQQIENSFTQPNGKVAIQMLEWARSATQEAGADLLELYCGNGNFSIALSDQFTKVLATEVAKSSVNSAQFNIAMNGIKNLNIVRLSSEEFTQAINKVREFRRLKGVELGDYHFSTVLVDPPRAGIDDDTLAMIKNFKYILYISCNPLTLCDNLKSLVKTHEVKRAALFDQFPYTEHMEAGVWLQQK